MIGKTRQNAWPDRDEAKIEEIFDPEVGQARGMLRRSMPSGKMRHARRRPSRDLAPWIAHYWMIHWDLRGCEPYLAESLPHPNVHLIFENEEAVVAGVQTHRFRRILEGKAGVFGVKFRPGGFRPFFDGPVSKLADRTIPAGQVFGKSLEPFKEIALSSRGESEKVQAADRFFLERVPEPDPLIARAAHLVDRILREPEIKSVDDLARSAGVGKRSLQRLFSEYVGASPKWVIRRYRLHELIEKFNSGSQVDWAQLALELGYFDQAHLINDFKSLVGLSPAQYQKLVSTGH